MSVVVERAGWSTVQDLGRPGFASSGVPRGGAYDEWALRAGNRLAGNDDGAAAIEVALRGVVLRFERDAVVAITGARYDQTLDDTGVPYAESFRVEAGQALTMGTPHAGVRATVCIRGGIATAPLLGSRSVSARAGLGAMLADGQRLPLGDVLFDAPLRRFASPIEPLGELIVRVVAGPQDDAFTEDARRSFFGEPYTVSIEADRVGMRLDGPRLQHIGEAGIDPEGVIAGAIQVPGDGRPIVLGPDGPATGGYAKIATVIGADLSLLAQASPGTTIRFEQVGVERARDALQHRRRALDEGIVDA